MEEIYYERVVTETTDAWLLLLDESDFMNPVKEWFPKSQCQLDEGERRIFVPEWLVVEKGLE